MLMGDAHLAERVAAYERMMCLFWIQGATSMIAHNKPFAPKMPGVEPYSREHIERLQDLYCAHYGL